MDCADLNAKKNLIPGHLNRIIVKFRENVSYFRDPKNYNGEVFERLNRGEWQYAWRDLIGAFAGVSISPLFTSIPTGRILSLVAQAKKMDREYAGIKQPNLLTYYKISCPETVALMDIEHLVRELKSWNKIIETVYYDPPSTEPNATYVKFNNDNYFWVEQLQDYLNPSSKGGVDAVAAWNQKGGSGKGQAIVDFERGWWLSHPDLVGKNILGPIGGTMPEDEAVIVSHGTQVLGVVCGQDNDKGGLGITPYVSKVTVASYWNKVRSDVLLQTIEYLPFGGVLLIEAQLFANAALNPLVNPEWLNLPIEKLPAEFDVIRLATALGIIVVAAAGNGHKDINTFLDLNSKGIIKDSGAILVAAAKSPEEGKNLINGIYEPSIWGDSNYGDRIDCYAWGDRVWTTTYNSDVLEDNTSMTDDPENYGTFGDTSAAAAIIAGVSLSMQGMIYFSKNGVRIDGFRMREILRNKDIGTPAAAEDYSKIKSMPDLSKFIKVLPTLALPQYINPEIDLFMKDFIGDTGNPFSIPHGKKVIYSPDILLKKINGVKVTKLSGKEKYKLSLRIRNRGVKLSTETKVYIYWWKASALIGGDDENDNQMMLLSTDTVSIAANGQQMTKEFFWSPAGLNEGVSYLFALIGKNLEGDDFPPFITKQEMEEYFKVKNFSFLETMVRRINNLVCRKIIIET